MRDARSIIEGICPTHGTPLERIDGYGWCALCGLGHSYTTDPDGVPSWNLHLRPRVAASGRDATSDAL